MSPFEVIRITKMAFHAFNNSPKYYVQMSLPQDCVQTDLDTYGKPMFNLRFSPKQSPTFRNSYDVFLPVHVDEISSNKNICPTT